MPSGDRHQLDDEHRSGDGERQEEHDDGEHRGGPHRGDDRGWAASWGGRPGEGPLRGLSSGDSPMSHLEFLTREGCGLCAAVLPMVEGEAARRGHRLTVTDVKDTEWEERFGDRLPVVIRDGAPVLFGRFGRREVRRALRR